MMYITERLKKMNSFATLLEKFILEFNIPIDTILN